jgi:hypothetical protein
MMHGSGEHLPDRPTCRHEVACRLVINSLQRVEVTLGRGRQDAGTHRRMAGNFRKPARYAFRLLTSAATAAAAATPVGFLTKPEQDSNVVLGAR